MSAERKTARANDAQGRDSFPLPPAQFSELLELVHQGAQESIPWGGALRRLYDELKADFAVLVLRLPSPHRPAKIVIASARGVEAWQGDLAEYPIFSLDPFVGLPSHRVVSAEEALGEAWLNSEYYRSFLQPLDVRFILGADIKSESDVECRFRMCRFASSPDFGERERNICNAVLPHFRISVGVHAQLDTLTSECSMYVQTMEQLQIGAVVLDEFGSITRINDVAADILAEKDGLSLSQGMVHATYRSEDHELQGLIKEALKERSGAQCNLIKVVSVTRPSGRTKLGVAVRPIPLSLWSEDPHRPAVAIFVRDPQRHASSSREAIRRLFGFTAAEAAVAMSLADGNTLDEAAEILHITKNTGRAHLRSIFAKTGVTRQTMLVRIVLNSIASLSQDGEGPPHAAGLVSGKPVGHGGALVDSA